jgi:hypothetical protein
VLELLPDVAGYYLANGLSTRKISFGAGRKTAASGVSVEPLATALVEAAASAIADQLLDPTGPVSTYQFSSDREAVPPLSVICLQVGMRRVSFASAMRGTVTFPETMLARKGRECCGGLQ